MGQQRQRDLQLEDYLAIARRRAGWIVLPTIVVMALAMVTSFILPARYTSAALILIEGQKVSGDYVKSVVNEDLNNRLVNMEEQIFSRTRLQPLIERFGLYANDRLTIDDKLDQLRKDVVITPLNSKDVLTGPMKSAGLRTTDAPGFTIEVNANHAQLAQQICGEIASMFFSENLKSREQSAEGTTEFLQGQLDQAKHALDAQDAKLATFQKQYFGQLPDQEQANLNLLGSLNAQLNAATDALSRAEEEKTYLETFLSQQSAAAEAGPANGNDDPASAQQLQAEVEQLQAKLTDLEARYTSDYPDVLKARRELEAAKKRMESPAEPAPGAASAAKKTGIANLQTQQLRAQLQASESGISAKKAQQARIQQQINLYQSRLQLSPAVQEQYTQLTRDNETAQHFYSDLLSKKDQSGMATDLERRQEGEQFMLIDPPNLPEKPTFPNRLLFAVGGLIGGLGVGCGLAALVEYQDKSLRNERDVLFFTNLETLAMVPLVASATPPEPKRKMLWRRNQPMRLAEAGNERH